MLTLGDQLQVARLVAERNQARKLAVAFFVLSVLLVLALALVRVAP